MARSVGDRFIRGCSLNAWLIAFNDDDVDDNDESVIRWWCGDEDDDVAAAAAAAAAAATAEKLAKSVETASVGALFVDIDMCKLWFWNDSDCSCLICDDSRCESVLDSFSQILAGDQINACDRDKLWCDDAAIACDVDGDELGDGVRGRVDKFNGSSSSSSGSSSFSGVSV